MECSFIDSQFYQKLLTNNELSGINRFLLENSTKQLDLLLKFFANDSHLMLVNGFMGTGKTALIDHISTGFVQDCVVLKYTCFETTVLDDLLLTFFEEFRKLAALEKIETPKIKSENFTQKINSYFEFIKNPIVVVIDSFDSILKSNKPEIIGFINYISALKNVKVILVSRTFDYSDFETKFEKTTILAFEKSIFEKFLRAEDVKQIGPISDELYKHTRGYFLYTDLSLKIMKLRNLGLLEFLDAFSKSFLSFNDFILREALALVDPVSGHLFRFLTVIRHPVSIKLLKNLHLYNEEKVLFFLNNSVLAKNGEYLYLPDYFKIISENSISEGVSVKIHQGCVDLYNTQLPLKPLERDLVISRQTMRNEIEFHSIFIPKKPQIKKQNVIESKEVVVLAEEVQPVATTVAEKDEQIKKMSFIFEDDNTGVLDKIADSIKDFLTSSDNRIREEQEENVLTLTELMNRAKQKEQQFDYKHAVSLYLKALAHKDDDDYYMFLPTIYNKLAQNYQNLSDWYNAQKYLELSIEFYSSTGDIEKVNEAKYLVANIFYMTFKRDKAKELLLTLDDSVISESLRLKVLVLLANLTSNSDYAYEFYKKALDINPVGVDKVVLAELYYKFAFENENRDEEEIAVQYYKKCIGLDLKNNPYLASSLSNLALLYDDIGETDLAIKYYQESLKIDEQANNFNGLYSSLIKLAEIYSAKNPEQALECFNKALEYAKILNEDFYIVSVNTAIGDFYLNRKENELAYKYLKTAYQYAQKTASKDNADKIMLRLNDIKIRIGEERFNELEK